MQVLYILYWLSPLFPLQQLEFSTYEQCAAQAAAILQHSRPEPAVACYRAAYS
jgi:hypothetical protein